MARNGSKNILKLLGVDNKEVKKVTINFDVNAEDFEAFEKVKKAGLLSKFAHFVLTDRKLPNNIFALAEALEKKQIEDEKKGENAE